MELNRYVYTANNPVNFSDPSGLTTAISRAISHVTTTLPASGFLHLVGVGVAAIFAVAAVALLVSRVIEDIEAPDLPSSDEIIDGVEEFLGIGGGGSGGDGKGPRFDPIGALGKLVKVLTKFRNAIKLIVAVAVFIAGQVLPRVVPYVLPHEENNPERQKPERDETCDPTVDPDCDEDVVWVVRGGVANAKNLMRGVSEHSGVPGLTGFSVQSEPGKTVEELAAAGRFGNNQISVTTVQRLAAIGVAVRKSPGRGFHKTAVTPNPLPEVQAQLISTVFTQRPNPAKWEG